MTQRTTRNRPAPLARRLAAGVGVAALAATAGGLAPAEAAPVGTQQRTHVGGGLLSPLSLAVQPGGTLVFSQNFAGQLMRKTPSGAPRSIASVPNGGEIGAVSYADGVITYAVSRGDNEVGKIRRIQNGRDRIVADLGEFERRANPDGRIRYGFTGLDQECAEQVEQPRYPGVRETHPYATARSKQGMTYVADAGANAIFKFGPSGRVRTVTALPGVVAPVSQATAEQRGFPECAVGQPYRFESVPTDVEIGPDGWLYVSTLGGQDDGSPISAVYKIHPRTGQTVVVKDGLVTATGLAIAPDKTIYVAELFVGRISRIGPGGRRTTFVSQPLPGDVEVSGDRLYATVDVLPGETSPPDGKVRSWKR